VGSVLVGVVGTLLGVVIGVIAQEVQARRSRRWRQEELLTSEKRLVYAQYLRFISASYAQAMSGQRDRSEDGNILAAAAEITLLSGPEVSGPAYALATKVIDTHSVIAADAAAARDPVPDVDRDRQQLIEIFKADLGWPGVGRRIGQP
jgi:hypothetical protein